MFIEEVGDVNGDKDITVTDATMVDDYMEPGGEPGDEPSDEPCGE